MRIVRWHPQERVDKPDLDAVSYLVLGEFRRTLRTLVQGEQSYVITGFAVETAAPPDTTIRVRMQPPGTERASALGSELTTAGLDKGQLIGDRDSSFINEGPSQQILDFALQPVGSYTVELRFPPYTDAIADNRAFWNPGGASEFISNVNTRTVGSWEIQFVAGAPSGGQWIPLATVAWNGVVVGVADITDIRTFAWEGASPWQQATQAGVGGVEDFGRAANRADQTQGRHRLRDLVRGVLRQIQDVKGQNDTGVFDWFSRVFSPFDPTDALGAQTKTMRTIDTVTYTVGDGVRTFGDFNGATGLDACLTHIAAIPAASMPMRIEIVLHGGVVGTGYVLTGQTVISGGLGSPVTVTIRAGQGLTNGATGLFGRPRITVDGATIPALGYALIVTGSGIGSLVLRGLDVLWTGTTAGGRGMFAANGYIDAEDCNLQQTVTPALPDVAAGYILLSSFAQKCRVHNCVIRGRIGMYSDPGTGSMPSEREMGVIEHCDLQETQIVLHADVPGVPGVDSVNGFAIRDCRITGRGTAIYTGSIALIDARCARKLRIENNTISYGTNENAIDGRTYNGETPFDWRIVGNRFDDSIGNGVHLFGAGGSGADGTGWALSLSSCLKLTLEENIYSINASIDAGAVRLEDADGYSILGDEHNFCGHGGGATDQYEGYRIEGAGSGSLRGHMAGVRMHSWVAGTTRVRCVNVDNAAWLTMDGCKFIGQTSAFATITPAAGFSAMRLDQTQDVAIEKCAFVQWANNSANSRCVTIVGTNLSLKFMGCIFRDLGGFAILRTAGASSMLDIDDCQHYSSAATAGDFADVRTVIGVRITNCTGFVAVGGPNTFISFDTANFLFMGNRAPTGDIDMNGAAVAGRGFNEAGQDLNLVNAYIP